VRRIAKRHGLRLVKSRCQEFTLGGPWALQSSNVMAHGMELKDVLGICNRLDGAR